LAQATVEIDEGTYTEPSRLTVGAWIDVWLDEYISNTVKTSTLHNYKKCCKTYLKPHLAAIKLSALNAPTIQKMINSLQSGEGEQKSLAPKTVKNIHGVLHKALQQAVKLGFIRSNPADACQLPRITKKEIKPLDKEQISDFLDAIKGHEFETLYLVTLFTGIRQSECIGLRWRCIDFDKGAITINAQLVRDYGNGGYYFDESTKNNKVRQITPAKFIMKALKKHRIEQMKARMLAGPAWIESEYVFTNELGEHLKHVTVYKGYKRIVSELGIPNSRYHDLRHSYAVAALHAGDDVKTVQENLGHHTAAFTLDQYGHVTEQMKRESANRMDMYIRGIKKG
jgi:integrase